MPWLDHLQPCVIHPFNVFYKIRFLRSRHQHPLTTCCHIYALLRYHARFHRRTDIIMSGFEFAGIVLGVVPIAFTILTSAGSQYRSARFDLIPGAFLYLGRIVDTDALQQYHWDINSWTDPEVLSWKTSHLASCNATAVAVCIRRALQQPDCSLGRCRVQSLPV